MNESRLERLLGMVQARHIDRSLPVPLLICLVCPEALDVDGAGVSLVTTTTHRSLGASDDIAKEIEATQAMVREGPCMEAIATRQPALEPDLGSRSALVRWPRFSPAVLDLGARAVYGFPLIVDSETIGALDLYSLEPRPLTHSEVDDALILADMAALAIKTSNHRDQSETLDLSGEPQQGWAHLAVVHHATGMTAVQLGISVDEAMLRLRAFVFAAERGMADVAGDIVNRRLRLEAWNHD
ncbi:MAG: GAF domain-containing protein [Ilumatobacteraceae bacterium]